MSFEQKFYLAGLISIIYLASSWITAWERVSVQRARQAGVQWCARGCTERGGTLEMDLEPGICKCAPGASEYVEEKLPRIDLGLVDPIPHGYSPIDR